MTMDLYFENIQEALAPDGGIRNERKTLQYIMYCLNDNCACHSVYAGTLY